MPKMSQMFPSKWLAAADLDEQDRTLTVADVTEELIGQGEEQDLKWVIHFREVDKGLVLNKTNATTITSALGDDTDEWIGRKVVLYPTEVSFSGKMVAAIRVKEKATRAANKATPKAQPGKTAAPVTQAEVDEDEDIPFDGDTWPKGRT